jgi:serine/threonine protein kinase
MKHMQNKTPIKLEATNKATGRPWSMEYQNFVERIFKYDPADRPTACELLKDPFLKNASSHKQLFRQSMRHWHELSKGRLAPMPSEQPSSFKPDPQQFKKQVQELGN